MRLENLESRDNTAQSATSHPIQQKKETKIKIKNLLKNKKNPKSPKKEILEERERERERALGLCAQDVRER